MCVPKRPGALRRYAPFRPAAVGARGGAGRSASRPQCFVCVEFALIGAHRQTSICYKLAPGTRPSGWCGCWLGQSTVCGWCGAPVGLLPVVGAPRKAASMGVFGGCRFSGAFVGRPRDLSPGSRGASQTLVAAACVMMVRAGWCDGVEGCSLSAWHL